ncbi:DUF1667 domain-containing protein [Candidatus Omnitrophota bacterium]
MSVDIESGKVISVEGNKCPKGEAYAGSESVNPVRVITSTVLTKGLSVKMVPVRTDGPIPKARIFEAMRIIRQTVLERPVRVGDVIVKDMLGTGINLISTRDA